MEYQNLVLRNDGYINQETQELIKNTRLLIAGCGVGSSIAEAALRMGFINLVLLDGDTIEPHNLNRQMYNFSDIGQYKAVQLAKHLQGIYPKANITTINEFLTKDNVKSIVEQCDVVMDTIDFLDLPAITYLHDEACSQKKPIITAASAGWGAVAIFFPPEENQTHCGFRDMFNLPSHGSVDDCSYLEKFGPFLKTIEHQLDSSIISAMSKAFTEMKDNKPCPAPHLSAGSFCVAALCLKIIVAFLNKETINSKVPLIINLNSLIKV